MKQRAILISVILFGFSACAPIGLLRTDEVFVYNRALDYVYLRALEAADSTPYWTIYETDKENTRFSLWNTKYSSLFDSDRRVITVQLKRVSRKQTSVELAPNSKTVVGGKDILLRIDRALASFRTPS